MKKINHTASKKLVIYAKKISIDNNDKKYNEVRDHCHYIGKYGRAAHNFCNLRHKIPNKICAVFIMVLNMTIIL